MGTTAAQTGAGTLNSFVSKYAERRAGPANARESGDGERPDDAAIAVSANVQTALRGSTRSSSSVAGATNANVQFGRCSCKGGVDTGALGVHKEDPGKKKGVSSKVV